MPRSIRTLRGLKDISTPFSANTKRADVHYLAYQRIAALEKEKARSTQEKTDLQKRLAKIESRVEEIDAEKSALLGKLRETDPAFYFLGDNNGSVGGILPNGPKERPVPPSNKPKKTPKVSQDIINHLAPTPAPTHYPDTGESPKKIQPNAHPSEEISVKSSQRARPVPSVGASGFKLKY